MLWGSWAWKSFLSPASRLQFPRPSLSSKGHIQRAANLGHEFEQTLGRGEGQASLHAAVHGSQNVKTQHEQRQGRKHQEATVRLWGIVLFPP